MFIDITLKITPQMITDAQGNEKKALSGHLGTHFDVMNKEFPLEYVERKGIVFDVSHVVDSEIVLEDINFGKIRADMFVAFHSGFIEKEGYGSVRYFTEHPQLAQELIEALLAKRVSIIGVDFAGLRRGKEHTPTDQYCADHGVFVVENLCNLGGLLDGAAWREFTASTYPLNFTGMSGLPCRVVARV
jgi:kynurenine formamidase